MRGRYSIQLLQAAPVHISGPQWIRSDGKACVHISACFAVPHCALSQLTCKEYRLHAQSPQKINKSAVMGWQPGARTAVFCILCRWAELAESFSLVSGRVSLLFCPAQPEHRLNGFNEFDVADRLRQRGWVSVPCFCHLLRSHKSHLCLSAFATCFLHTRATCALLLGLVFMSSCAQHATWM